MVISWHWLWENASKDLQHGPGFSRLRPSDFVSNTFLDHLFYPNELSFSSESEVSHKNEDDLRWSFLSGVNSEEKNADQHAEPPRSHGSL